MVTVITPLLLAATILSGSVPAGSVTSR